MPTDRIGAALRREVVARAESICEYCLMADSDSIVGGAIDHIISRQHGGQTTTDDLAYACSTCNRSKGRNIASLLLPDGPVIRLYHPRRDVWSEHFEWRGTLLLPISEVGTVTERLLGFNEASRIERRHILIRAGRFPSAAALRKIKPDLDHKP